MQNHIYKINTGFIVDKVGGDYVVFDGERSVLHTFNETAYFIFNLIQKGLSTQQIANKVAESYKVDLSIATIDTINLTNSFLKKKLISKV